MISAKRCRGPRLTPPAGKLASVLAMAGLVMAVGTGVQAQTVDCTIPSGPVARVICADPDLIELDLDMGDAFRELIRSVPRDMRPSILRTQRDWLIQRNSCLGLGDVGECLRAEMELRITDLSQRLAGSVGVDAPFARVGPTTEPTAEPQGPREAVEQTPLPDSFGPAGNQKVISGPVPPRIGGATPPARLPATPPAPPPPAAGDDETAPPESSAPLDDADAAAIAKFMSAGIWRAEIASGVRPGTIYMFHSNGLLLTADCVEAYRIGSWRVEGSGLRLEDGSGRKMTAEIVDRGSGYVRLKLTGARKNRVLDLVFRPARGPFACTS
ncbi:hypothetical protein MNBD_ALPHA04-581 [hydrothermal vent metagenome]|uniref:Lysozyme inhibitor LprI N-terminal domain-containing protein n=1 Tax=hydrothermal vent metagenome TaxID=652676 RepID=A0A3B0SYT2_9ZZZZ